jgi:hypothetical protein
MTSTIILDQSDNSEISAELKWMNCPMTPLILELEKQEEESEYKTWKKGP